MLTEKEKLTALTNLGIELSQVQDLDILMERILTEARKFVNADAGSIYIRDGNKLNFTYTQNDTLARRLRPGEKLIYSTFSMDMNDRSMSGYVAVTGQPLNIADVYVDDPALPFRHNHRFDEASGYRTRSCLTLPLKNTQGEVLGVLQMINAQDDRGEVIPFSATDEKMMEHFASIAAVALARARMTRSIILRMIRMAELRDPRETGAHVNRVGGYAVEIYERWALKRSLSQQEIDRNRDTLRMAAMLHDVGKVGISDTILNKPGRLTEEEFTVMQQHSALGARLFGGKESELDEAAFQVALNHHEKWNGKGYPGWIDLETGQPLPEHRLPNGRAAGKKGEEIPLYGRIVALADVYDALSSRRVYKDAWEEQEVLDLLAREAGQHFDPELVELFLEGIDVIRAIRRRYSESPS